MPSPGKFKQALRSQIQRWIREFKGPHMLYGYAGADGQFHARTRLGDTVCLVHPERIAIADNVFVWHYSILDGTGGLEIGEGTQIGAWVGIFTHSSHLAVRLYGRHYFDVPEAQKHGFEIAPVKIGRYAFIAPGSKILPGVSIGDGAIVAAGSVVKSDVLPFTLVSGNPATLKGSTRHLDAEYLTDPMLARWYEEWQEV